MIFYPTANVKKKLKALSVSEFKWQSKGGTVILFKENLWMVDFFSTSVSWIGGAGD